MNETIQISKTWFTGKVQEQVLTAAMRGLMKAGQVVVGEAQKQTPVLSGTLKRSITVTKGGLPNESEIFTQAKAGNVPQCEEKGQELAVYVSANTPYSRKIHESMELKHTNGQAKYLERGLQATAPRIQSIVEKELKKL